MIPPERLTSLRHRVQPCHKSQAAAPHCSEALIFLRKWGPLVRGTTFMIYGKEQIMTLNTIMSIVSVIP